MTPRSVAVCDTLAAAGTMKPAGLLDAARDIGEDELQGDGYGREAVSGF